MRPLPYLLPTILCAVCVLLPACGERPSPAAMPPARDHLASSETVARQALFRAAEAERAADEALARAPAVNREDRRLLEELQRERRRAQLTASVNPPLDPAVPRPPAGLVLDGEVVSFDEASGVVVLSLGAETGIRQGYRVTISRGTQYVGIVEIDGVEAGRSRGRSIRVLQKRAPEPGDRAQLR